MRTCVRIRCVFNQKAHKLKPTDLAPIKYEIRFQDGKKYYIDSGFEVQFQQWDKSGAMVVGHLLSGKLNKSLQDFIARIRALELQDQEEGIPFTIDRLKNKLKGTDKARASFIDYANKAIGNRMDICGNSIYTHKRAIRYLDEKFPVMDFSLCTYINIVEYDNHLKSKHLSRASIAKLHQVVSHYLTMAKDAGYLKENPYSKFPIKRGKPGLRNRLDDSEIELLRKFKSQTPMLHLVGEIAKFQTWTGMTHKDIMAVTYSANFRKNEYGDIIDGLRQKNDEFFFVPILPEAKEILDRNREKGSDRLFPFVPLHRYNIYLKLIADGSGIHRKLTSYVLRHTFATQAIRKGIPLEVVQAILGHMDIHTTQIYAKTEKQYVMQEISKMNTGPNRFASVNV